MRTIRSLAVGTVASITLAGCASVQPRASFPAVRDDVATRVRYDVVWDDGGVASQSAHAKVDALLARPLSMDGAVQVALLSNRRLQATYESLGIAQADLVEAGLLRNPIFDGSVRLRSGSPTIDLGVAFDFLDVFFIPLRERVAAARLDVARAEVTTAVLALVAETRDAYVDVQAAQQTLELRRQVASATGASFDFARRLRAAGNTRELDVLNEQALQEESRLAVAAAEQELTHARETLNRRLGAYGPATSWTIVDPLPVPGGAGEDGADVERQAIASNVSLKAQSAAVEAGFRELRVAAPMSAWDGAAVGVSSERDRGEWEVGPAFALPIPIFNQTQPAVARSAAALRQARDRYFAAAVEVRSAAREAWSRERSLRQRVDFYRQTMLPLRAAVVEQTQLQFNAMQVGAFTLLAAKRDQIDAGHAYVALLADHAKAASAIELLLAGYCEPDASLAMPSASQKD